MSELQEQTPIKLPEGLSLEEARDAVEWLPITNDTERVDLILTILDFKVGTAISPPNDEVLIGITEESFQNLRIFYVVGEHREWYVAKSQADAERLHQVFEVTKDVREQGRMSGYPESAVENYARTMELIITPGKTQEEIDNILRESNGGLRVPPEILREDYMVFQDFELSANNWQNELETVKKWAEAVERFDPGLYKRRVAIRHRSTNK